MILKIVQMDDRTVAEYSQAIREQLGVPYVCVHGVRVDPNTGQAHIIVGLPLTAPKKEPTETGPAKPTQPSTEKTYPGGRTKEEWDAIAANSYRAAEHLPED